MKTFFNELNEFDDKYNNFQDKIIEGNYFRCGIDKSIVLEIVENFQKLISRGTRKLQNLDDESRMISTNVQMIKYINFFQRNGKALEKYIHKEDYKKLYKTINKFHDVNYRYKHNLLKKPQKKSAIKKVMKQFDFNRFNDIYTKVQLTESDVKVLKENIIALQDLMKNSIDTVQLNKLTRPLIIYCLGSINRKSKKLIELMRFKTEEYIKENLKYKDGYIDRLTQENMFNMFANLAEIQRIQSSFSSSANERVLKEIKEVTSGIIDGLNEEYIAKEKKIYNDILNNFEGKSIDESQKDIILRDESNLRVVAPAGSGKTFLMLAKVNYLIKSLKAKENEILILSFTNATVDDIKLRMNHIGYKNIDVYTFHKFAGKEYVKKAYPNIREVNSSNIIHKIFYECLKDEEFKMLVGKYIKNFYYENGISAYMNNDNKYETLLGIKVKSLEELEIANFLTINNIRYEYEKEYITKNGVIFPDFYLSDYNVYIEHYGINRNGNTHYTYKDNQRYKDAIEWKRKLYKSNNEVVIETYSSEKREGVLLINLKNKLEDKNIKLNQVNDEYLYKIIDKNFCFNKIESKVKRIIDILQRKGIELDLNNPEIKNLQKENSENNLILEITKFVHAEFIKYLKTNDLIDLNKEISTAIDIIKNNEIKSSNYKYIIVDEFQDVNSELVELIKEVKSINNSKLFCVGDDWQSIYNFVGSNTKFFIDFEEYFPCSYNAYLNKTFRFNREIADISKAFVMKNSKQINKEVISNLGEKYSDDSFIIKDVSSNNQMDKLNSILEDDIPMNSSVLILRRNRDTIFMLKNREILHYRAQGKHITQSTIHKAKGLEADYVIIIDMFRERSKLENSELIIINTLEKNYIDPKEEERRIMYVAMTRARKKVFLLTRRNGEFVNELLRIRGEAYIKSLSDN